VFLAIPLFGVPLLRKALDTTPPTKTDLTNHVIICGFSAMDDVLKSELEEAEIPYLFIDSDPEMVKRLNDADMTAIYGNAEEIQTLENANARSARALVADLDDETNPTVILSAARINPAMKIISVVRTRDAAPYQEYAGADQVVISKESLGESLAKRSMKTISERFQEEVDPDVDLEFDEYLVEEGSDLVGKTIQEIDTFGGDVTVIGGWFGARFLISPSPNTMIPENTILLITGKRARLENTDLRKLPSHVGHPSRVVVCGHGDVGSATTRQLRNENIDVTVVDAGKSDAVDVVGDITNEETLERADIENTRSLVLAVNSDAIAIYATLLVKRHAPDVEIIARANDPENVWKLYNAGADYVLSLPDVTGEVLASALIDEAAIFTTTDDFDFVRTEAPALEGQSVREADVRNRTGCTIVAIERNDQFITEFGTDFVFQQGDSLIAAGPAESVEEFEDFVR
ncbi:potassium channel family protein, partial [Halobiforma nitratireducens]